MHNCIYSEYGLDCHYINIVVVAVDSNVLCWLSYFCEKVVVMVIGVRVFCKCCVVQVGFVVVAVKICCTC